MAPVSETSVRSRLPWRVGLAVAAVAAAVVGGGAGRASAHTESEYAAVPAGDEITVNFAPTHGCSGSPTTEVSVRVPAPGATAGEVEGFTASAEPDGDRTILRWTGGLLPADEEGEFPITFTVPDTVGELLLFPTVQTCEVGEIAWIDGDPEGEYPAVRMLVLAAGSEPAHTIDDVPADAPGREQLTQIVDVDNPVATTVAPETTAAATTAAPATSAPATTAPATTAPATTAPSATTSSASEAPATTAPTTSDPVTATTLEEDDDSSDAGTIVFVVVVIVLAAGAAAGVFLMRRRRS